MVEGPGATNNKNKCMLVVGEVIKGIQGSGVTEEMIRVTAGRRLVEVLKLGKEVFLLIQGEEAALRLHFGMSGSLTTSSERKANPKRRLDLDMIFESSLPLRIRVYDSTVTLVKAMHARDKVGRMQHLDVCEACFDIEAAVANIILKKNPNLTIGPTVLDQTMLPGAGNIIKCEALHRAHIAPHTVVRKLSREQIQRLVYEVRDYAIRWLQTKFPVARESPTDWKQIEKKVYNRIHCSDCNHRLTVDRDTLRRVTFWCPACCSMPPPSILSTEHESLTAEKEHQYSQKAKRQKLVAAIQQHATHHTCVSKKEKLLRVRKDGETKGRLFWSCTSRKCSAFAWADSAFPCCNCPTNPPRPTRLILSKTQASGGRWFHACSGDRGTPQNCGFFAWANDDLISTYFGEALHPLL